MTSLVKKETFSVSIEDYTIEYQGTAFLDIDVTLEFKPPRGKRKSKDYYEFQQIIQYIDSYLVDYPNETDYWEILNTNLAISLITDKIPTAWWNTTYKLAKSVAELPVDLEHQQRGSARTKQKDRFSNNAERLRKPCREGSTPGNRRRTNPTNAYKS